MLELTKKIEHIWCIDAKIMCTLDIKVKIPKIICNNKKNPITFIDKKKSDNLFLQIFKKTNSLLGFSLTL